MPEEIDILKSVCTRLEMAEIPYMLTGSLAANFYAVPRMTRDIDFVIEILQPEIDRFIEIFQEDFYLNKGSIENAVNWKSMFNIIHNKSIFKIDFVLRKDSTYRTTEFIRKRRVEFNGTPLWIVSPEDLIISKLDWTKDRLSDLQLRDIKNLFQSIKNLDHAYIREWVADLHLDDIYAKALTYE